jgi:hypothetical protein
MQKLLSKLFDQETLEWLDAIGSGLLFMFVFGVLYLFMASLQGAQ